MNASKTARRILLPMSIIVLAAGYLAIGRGGWASAPPLVQAPAIKGMANMSGKVTASKPFKAAQVYIKNVDMRIMYMVFTNAGQFRAVSLFPGNYEVAATAKGFKSDVQKVTVKAGDSPKINLTFQEVAASNQGETDPLQNVETLRTNRIQVSFDTYDNIYPAGKGRDVAERTCIICHGENFIPSQPGDAAVWNARIDRMMGKANFDRPANSYAEGLLSYRAQQFRFSKQDREDLFAYLVKNFGPDAPRRNVRTVQETPLDEAKLSKAMFMEYYVPEDPAGRGVHAPEYALPGGGSGTRRIQDVRFDAEGNVYGSDRGIPRRLVKVNPRTGERKEWVTDLPGRHDLDAGTRRGRSAKLPARLQPEDREVGRQRRHGSDGRCQERHKVDAVRSVRLEAEPVHGMDHGWGAEQVRERNGKGKRVPHAKHQRHSVRHYSGQERQPLDSRLGQRQNRKV
ncbi:MAG: hypothetical protein DMG14_23510 [Acidobacteria bacterium]|nr:MAG: hypothetical protein DMG14_23510 [Acidobacteriota bacterium]